jgi:hypothetical protein
VAHSFGVVIGTEYLAKYNSKSNRNIRYISLGGPLLMVAAKSDRVAEAISQVTENQNIVSWVDYFSNQDWLCTFSPVNSAATNYSSHPITSSVSFDEKIKGASHDLYFQDLDVLEAIVGKQI